LSKNSWIADHSSLSQRQAMSLPTTLLATPEKT
jgi:hypothetical protein